MSLRIRQRNLGGALGHLLDFGGVSGLKVTGGSLAKCVRHHYINGCLWAQSTTIGVPSVRELRRAMPNLLLLHLDVKLGSRRTVLLITKTVDKLSIFKCSPPRLHLLNDVVGLSTITYLSVGSTLS